MKTHTSSFVLFLLIFTSGTFPNKTDFSGKLNMKIKGESYTFDAMKRSDSRLSFQDKGIAVYIVNPKGEGTIAEITILSNSIYDMKSHRYELGTKKQKPKTMMDIYNKDSSKNKDILNFKFRRIDQMDQEEYFELSKGTVNLDYDDEAGYFKISFVGEDKNGISISGLLELDNPYVIDRRD
ncbi:hypothetical protein MATR_37050 [Marivirga tractuosa]|uniref:Uncharacterized protein n=1 Tax=Marivirga tractuosa (strain ATCC 23168 / DSM 4126 / NBRC 15989 / NCIMB 1408 / VKM B-1430 / H-43) TaxID=643867 RepID=E4TN35_MARTH|nr:hypothetical protein [Marivirga tractuosa]ADR22449.1 hypothetical protein Ftrac_2471 [Marivirga tractuosa DSM 4126]BDD16880.1 hypothetical protein MATR_37050 [Marivirga tractuosa]